MSARIGWVKTSSLLQRFNRFSSPQCTICTSKLNESPKAMRLACKQQQQQYPRARLYGAIVDVCSAYTQVAQSVETAKAHSVEIQAPQPSLVEKFIVLVAVFLCVIFGDSRAGNVYCICAESIHRQHNAKYCRSETYIDDGGIMTPKNSSKNQEMNTRSMCEHYSARTL